MDATYKIVIDEIKSRTLPEVSDEFAKSVGEYEAVVELHRDVKQDIKFTVIAE